MPYLYVVLLLGLFFCSSCQNPYENIQQSWIVQKGVYKGEEWRASDGQPPTLHTFTSDSLIIYHLGFDMTEIKAYHLKAREDGGGDQLIVTETRLGREEVDTILVQVYKDSLLYYNVPNDLSSYLVFKPMKEFQQAPQKQALEQQLSGQVYSWQPHYKDTSITVELMKGNSLIVPHWMSNHEKMNTHWGLYEYKGELFLVWGLENVFSPTLQVAAVGEDSILLWDHQEGDYVTLKQQPPSSVAYSKEAFVGYWKEVDSFHKAKPAPPPIPSSEADLLYLAVSKDSLRSLLSGTAHQVALRRSPSGNYWVHPNILSHQKYYGNIACQVELLNNQQLKITLPRVYSPRHHGFYNPHYYLKRITKEEFTARAVEFDFIKSLPE